jgi:hypothetical protein
VPATEKPPTSLPEDILLFCADPQTGVVPRPSHLRRVLAGAVLTELMLRGAITVDGARITEVRPLPAPVDPFADRVVTELLRTRPKFGFGAMRLERWVRKVSQQVDRDYRELMAGHGVLRARTRRVLGVFRVTDWTLTDGAWAQQQVERVDRVIRPEAYDAFPGPPDRRDVHFAALIGAFPTGERMYSGRAGRALRRRMKDLTRSDPIADATRKVIKTDQSGGAGAALGTAAITSSGSGAGGSTGC